MPELPEVETICRGIQPYLEGQKIQRVVVRHYGLRWPIMSDIHLKLANKLIASVNRRAKYLLLDLKAGTAIIHLGMSGRLRILTQFTSPQKHDHVDVELSNKMILRFTDPRRFGAFLWTEQALAGHPLFKHLGPEPLDKNFSANYLWQRAQKKQASIKSFIMNNQIVVGVGNIYAAESLFIAKIHPQLPAHKLSFDQCQQLVKAIKLILRQAIKRGGTTLKDFVDSTGKPGYFSHYLKVYGREGQPCLVCQQRLQMLRIGQRSTVYCGKCQLSGV